MMKHSAGILVYKIENGMITTEDGLVISRENLNKEIENKKGV